MSFSGNIKIFLIAVCCFMSGCSNHNHSDNDDHDEHDEHHHTGSTIIIEPEKASKFGIETEVVVPASFRSSIKTGGKIETASSSIYTVTAKKSGIINLAPDITSGTSVKNGALIATISTQGMEGGDRNLAAATNLQAAKAEYERLKPLYEEKLITASSFLEAERAYKEAKALLGTGNSGGTLTLTTPQGGSVSNLYVTSGQFVEAGAPIATITQNSRLTLKADLPARFASQIPIIESASFIPEGSDSIFFLEDLGGIKISDNSISASSNGYFPLYFAFSGNSIQHPSGYAEVYLLSSHRDNVISVPRSALLELQGNKYLYVVNNGHEYEKRLVTTGADNGTRIEIVEGLQKGDTVVTKGTSIVRMNEVSAVAPPAHTHNH